MSRSQLVYDTAIRHQIYTERLKHTMLDGAGAVFARMLVELRAAVGTVEAASLSDLSRQQLRNLLRRLTSIQGQHYSAILKRLLAFIRAYIDTDRVMLPEVFEASSGVVPVGNPMAQDKLYKQIMSEYVPGTGLTITAMLASLSATAAAELTRRVRMAVANGLSPYQLNSVLVGTSALGFGDGAVKKLSNQMNATLATAFQFAIAKMVDDVTGLFTDRYMWSSILDTVTTDICRRRNGRTFIRGEGPLPPAHYRCRSSTVPVFLRDTGPVLPASLFQWFKGQPPDFVSDNLPRRLAETLARGEARSADFAGVRFTGALTLSDYKAKVNLLKTGTNG